MKIEAVIFDCDGVVVDSDQLQREAEQQTAPEFAEANNLAYDPDKTDWSQMQGWARKRIASSMFGIPIDSDLATKFMHAVVDTTIKIANAENLSLINGVTNFVNYLALHGLQRGLATSSNRRIFTRYCELVQMDFFPPQYTIAHGECRANKPSPDPYLEVMRRIGVEPQRTLVIEDSGSGISAARYAGATVLGLATTKTAHYLHTETGAHMVAEDFRHAAHLMQGLL